MPMDAYAVVGALVRAEAARCSSRTTSTPAGSRPRPVPVPTPATAEPRRLPSGRLGGRKALRRLMILFG
jgi:hypothetical protein